MTTHADTDTPAAEATRTKGRIRPHHLAIGLGIAIALFTVVSGVLPLITNWHNDNEHTREVFGDIPGPLQVAFYTVIPVMIAWGAFRFADRMKNWERGKPAPSPPHERRQRQAPLRRLPRRRLHAHPAAATRPPA